MNYLDLIANLHDYPLEGAGTTSIPDFVLDSQPGVIQLWVMRELIFGNLLKKNPHVSVDVDPDEAASAAFFAGEQRCLNYNTHFGQLLNNPRLRTVMETWRRCVRTMMGNVPKLRYDVVTAGATTTCPKGNSVIERFQNAEITEDLYGFLLSFGPPSPFVLWDWHRLSLTKGNVAKFVAKTAKVSRLVQPEPSVNASVQRELGQHLNKRCRYFGIEIETGQDRHRDMAWLASILGHLATDDQSNASGHIYSELIRYLVSPQWWAWLDSSRSKFTWVESSPIHAFPHWWKLQSFATMGNGFCFELETIVFYSLIWAVTGSRRDVSVFGDDCIYPVEHVPSVHKAFKAVGFVVNVEKSFSTGGFRESCGGDYLNGHNVRPLYLKRKFDNSYDLTIMANQVFSRFRDEFYPGSPWLDLWQGLVERIPEEERLYGPSHLGDAVLHCSDDALWGVKEVGRHHKRLLIATWRLTPESTTHFGKLVYQGIAPDHALRLLSTGQMRGWGLVSRKNAKTGEVGCVYKPQPAAGTRYRAVIEQRPFSSTSNGVDETRPLSVFDVLKDTKCPDRLYVRNVRERDLFHQRSKLARLLNKFKDNVGAFDALSIDVDY